MLGCMVAGVYVAVTNRNPAPPLAGTGEELARRDLRQQYRQLVARDPALAASMQVGRPDLARQFDDGGLVDLNSLPAAGLERFAAMSSDEAADVLRVRAQAGRLSALSELEAFSSLSQSTLARLREIAVFVRALRLRWAERWSSWWSVLRTSVRPGSSTIRRSG